MDLEILIDALHNQIATNKEHLARGRASDWAEYRFVVGQIRGLETALQEVKDFKTRHIDED